MTRKTKDGLQPADLHLFFLFGQEHEKERRDRFSKERKIISPHNEELAAPLNYETNFISHIS